MALTPLAFGLSSSPFILPLDVVRGVALPFHAHVGLNYVITDYVPKVSHSLTTPARVVMLVATGCTVLGIAKLNFMGEGLTNTVLGLWRGDKKKDAGGKK